jgi:hypothetical protein
MHAQAPSVALVGEQLHVLAELSGSDEERAFGSITARSTRRRCS